MRYGRHVRPLARLAPGASGVPRFVWAARSLLQVFPLSMTAGREHWPAQLPHAFTNMIGRVISRMSAPKIEGREVNICGESDAREDGYKVEGPAEKVSSTQLHPRHTPPDLP